MMDFRSSVLLSLTVPFLIASVSTSAQCEGGARAFTAESRTYECTLLTGTVPYLNWTFRLDCLNDCGETWSSLPTVSESAQGICQFVPVPLTCVPEFAQKDHVLDLYGTSNAWSKKLLAGCSNDVLKITQGSCPCAPSCNAPTDPPPSPGEEEQDPGTEPKGDPLYGSPIIISLSDGQLQLTDVAGGVSFDINGDGSRERMAWTAASTDDAFLVLDRDQDGEVDHGRELFGDYSPQLPSAEPNGFRALAVFDDPLNGGNGDGWIDGLDPVFQYLETWTDSNHDGISQPDELRTLPESGIEALGIEYRAAGREDRHGNQLRFYAPVIRAVGPGSRRAWDVFLLIAAED